MKQTTCGSCKAPIVFATTENGRQMPLDPEPCNTGNVWIGDDGIARVMGKGDETMVTVPLYKSHFATCPGAGSHRKGKS